MKCSSVILPNGVSAIVCSHRQKPRRCSVDGCARDSTRLCDFPHGHTTCSKPLCNAHAVPVGFKGEKDYCPNHERKADDAFQRRLPL